MAANAILSVQIIHLSTSASDSESESSVALTGASWFLRPVALGRCVLLKGLPLLLEVAPEVFFAGRSLLLEACLLSLMAIGV